MTSELAHEPAKLFPFIDHRNTRTKGNIAEDVEYIHVKTF
jgi:hypothetical protein